MMRAPALILVASLGLVGPAYTQEPTLTVRNNRDAQELIIEIGPLHLEANSDHAGVQQPKAQVLALPISGYLHGFTFEMLDAQGRVIPSRLLHHVNIISPQRRELFSQIMQRVAAAGSETGSVTIPRFLGYPVTTGDSLVFTAMFHNPTDESYHEARLRIRARYSGAKPSVPVLAIQPFYLDVMPPAGFHVFDLPPGRSEKSWEGKPAIAGRMLAVSGHMHKYGVALRLEDVTENKVIWEATPTVDEQGNVIAMPKKFFVLRAGVPIKPENTYRLTAIYDNPTGETLAAGGMGALGGVFVPADFTQWPAVNRNDPDYLADLKVTYEPGHGSHGGSHGGH